MEGHSEETKGGDVGIRSQQFIDQSAPSDAHSPEYSRLNVLNTLSKRTGRTHGYFLTRSTGDHGRGKSDMTLKEGNSVAHKTLHQHLEQSCLEAY